MMASTVNSWVALPAWSAWALAGGMLLAGAIWTLLYILGRRWRMDRAPGMGNRLRGGGLLAARILAGGAALWMLFQLMARTIVLALPWSPAWVALVAAGAVEAILWLYGLERRSCSRRAGLALVSLRLALLGLVVLLLLQPAAAWVWNEHRNRTLAVMVDASDSMRVADRQLPSHEKLRLAESLGVSEARRPVQLEQQAQRLRTLREGLLPELAWLERLAQSKKDTIRVQLAGRRKDLHERFNVAAEAVNAVADALDALARDRSELSQDVRTALLDAKANLTRQVRPRLLDAANLTHEQQAQRLPDQVDRLNDLLTRTAAELAKAAPTVDAVAAQLDAAQYQRLSAQQKSAVDAVAGLSRLELAKAALLHPGTDAKGDATPSLLERLSRQYSLKVYTFGVDLAEADPAAWKDPLANPPASQPASAPAGPEGRRTNFGAALRRVLAAQAGEEFAGVVLLSDGQDNGRDNLEVLARQMGGSNSALIAGVVGGEKPPADAAIVSIEAPDAVFLTDRMFVNARLKLDGLAGKNVKITLWDDKQPVDSQSVRVVGDSFRASVQLGDEPKSAGAHDYRIELEQQDGEVFTDNNGYNVRVSVTDEKTHVLLIESRPTWEFRYLKNLFSGRDKTVALQYVLLHPDRFVGQPATQPSPAAVGREQEEATEPPTREEEWMKFDVIFLGDVDPAELPPDAVKFLRKFVEDRGGTLVMLAGRQAMPGRYAGTPLAELIPLQLDTPFAPDANATGKEGFRLALTPAGKDHVMLRQDVEPEKSQSVWDALPPVYWRSPYAKATAAATVLVWAVEPDTPKWLSSSQPSAAPPTSPEGLSRQREAYQREHAVMAVAPHGLGKVLMLTTDNTWRLRYRAGDTYHHKFWGQVLRWATAGKLPAGTHLVKLGAEKTRYAPNERPVVRAKLVKEDFSPLVTQEIAVKVLAGERVIGRVPMKYQPDSPGLYSATLDELPAGTYKLELDAPAAAALLAKENVQAVSTEISVDPAASAEQVELSANRALMGHLAGLTHRGQAVPVYQLASAAESLPPGTWVRPHRRQLSLRASWPPWTLLGLFCGLAGAEWILRKRLGLA